MKRSSGSIFKFQSIIGSRSSSLVKISRESSLRARKDGLGRSDETLTMNRSRNFSIKINRKDDFFSTIQGISKFTTKPSHNNHHERIMNFERSSENRALYSTRTTTTTTNSNDSDEGRSNDREPSSDPGKGQIKNRGRRYLSMVFISSVLIGFTFSIGYIIGTTNPPKNSNHRLLMNFLWNMIKKSSNEKAKEEEEDEDDDDEGRIYREDLRRRLEGLEIVKSLRSNKEEWEENEFFKDLDRSRLKDHLTIGSLSGIGKFAILPLVFTNHDETEGIVVVHVGKSLCGFEGILHGGLSATICDEGLATLAFRNLPSKIGVTASLKLNYKRPIMIDQFLILKMNLVKKIDRKVYVSGSIENLDGQTMVEAEALFIEPRHAKFLKMSLLP